MEAVLGLYAYLRPLGSTYATECPSYPGEGTFSLAVIKCDAATMRGFFGGIIPRSIVLNGLATGGLRLAPAESLPTLFTPPLPLLLL